MARLYLIRHARPSSTWGGHDDDPGLDAQGQAQAQAARDWLLALPEAERPRRVVSSPLRRCRETAEPTAQALGVEIEIDALVGEIPTPGGLAHDQRPEWLRKAFGGTWAEIEGDLDYDAWRGAVLEALRHRGDTAVFSHYVAINAVVSRLTGDDRVLAFRPDHASITVLEIGDGDIQLVARGAEAQTSVL
ncbi:histidine phosphatase family protein [Phenylobacterium sp. J426]|uniref:histidine phosphatase family protein n=1 Tax=Phenylobacterium sp. J426 TaxID=2898439 RepID=UPI002150A1F9|nr:histidine phosphatase family protein [Phenylobacterium sp. J426]MCR5875581.1 histidine phosphatase family protein [Phenylobacterium sp. J426]